MSSLFISEKPSVAKALVTVLGGRARGDRYTTHTKSGDIVVALRGHVLELVPPGEYSPALKRWDLANYPFFPETWRYQVRSEDDYAARIAAVQAALPLASEVVHAGDPDREGQRIVDELLEYLGYTGPVMRILPNATEVDSVREAIRDKKPNTLFKGLSMAALGRQKADYLVGMNLSPAVSKAIAGGDTNSIGRVQTVVLGMIVRRDLERERFDSRPFYELEATVKTTQGDVVLRYAPKAEDRRITDHDEAKKLAKALKGFRGPLTVETNAGNKRPPDFYTRLSFQGDAKKYLGWNTEKAAKALQKLYDETLTTYPRGESVHLEVKQKALIGPLLGNVGEANATKAIGQMARNTVKSPYIRDNRYDDAKASPHHAIIVTRTKPDAKLAQLDPELAGGYLLIAARYLMGHMPDAKVSRTQILMKNPHIALGVRGETILDQGWMIAQDALELAFPKKRAKGKAAAAPLPNITNGTIGEITAVKVVKKATTPPDAYTDLSLMEDMKAVAKYVEKAEIAKLLKETEGLGTPATRDAVAPTLQRRGYIVIEGAKNTITSTEYGRALIAAIPATLKDPSITGLWEERMRAIEKDPDALAEFMDRTVKYVTRQVADVKNLAGKVRIRGLRGQLKDKPAKAASKRRSQPSSRAVAR